MTLHTVDLAHTELEVKDMTLAAAESVFLWTLVGAALCTLLKVGGGAGADWFLGVLAGPAC